jgi:hypothetical protein
VDAGARETTDQHQIAVAGLRRRAGQAGPRHEHGVIVETDQAAHPGALQIARSLDVQQRADQQPVTAGPWGRWLVRPERRHVVRPETTSRLQHERNFVPGLEDGSPIRHGKAQFIDQRRFQWLPQLDLICQNFLRIAVCP